MLVPILGWILFGFVIGVLARFAYPGRQRLGFVRTTLLGIAGSFVGGFVSFLFFGGSAFQASGWIGSLLGAVILLAAFWRRPYSDTRSISS